MGSIQLYNVWQVSTFTLVYRHMMYVPAFLWLILLELIVVAQASARGPSNSLGPPLFVLLIQTMHMIICTCMKVNIFLLVCCTKSTYQINHRIRFRKKKKQKKNNNNNKLCYLTMAIIWYISILELLVNMSTVVHKSWAIYYHTCI